MLGSIYVETAESANVFVRQEFGLEEQRGLKKEVS